MKESFKCKKCGRVSDSLQISSKDKGFIWDNLYYCKKCFAEFRKQHNIMSLSELNEHYKKIDSKNKGQ
jgi:DNA-directed RNA polymerase subunit RPC12/RpoP